MTIVDYFDPRNGEHLEAWESVRHKYNISYHSLHFATACGINEFDYEWPIEWGLHIQKKMADAWMEEYLPPPHVELRENVQRVKLVPVDG